MRETWRDGSFTGEPKDMLNKALEMGACFHRGPVLGNMEGRYFLRAFDRKVKFLFIRKTLIGEFDRHVTEGRGNRRRSPQGFPLGNLEVFHVPGLLRGRWEGSGNGVSLIN